MKKIIFLVSGGGGNLRFINQAIKMGLITNVELVVIASRQCGGLEYAKTAGLKNYQIRYERKNPEELCSLIREHNPNIIVTNWNKIIDEGTVQEFKGRLINLHYSLLPAFAGLLGVEPINRAYISGCKFIGPTCHFLDEGIDTGEIISQAVFETKILQSDAVQLMFRSGCLLLLNSICYLLDIFSNSDHVFEYEKCFFSPPLGFDIDLIDENFWMGI